MHSKETDTQAPQAAHPPIRRRRLLVPGALAGAVALALAGAYLGSADQAMATLQPSPAAGAAAFAGPPSFADIAARVTPAVVNIAVTRQGGVEGHPRIEIPNLPEGSPLGELFRHYFHRGSPSAQGFEVPHELHGLGSGFIVDPQGYIVTNDHVIDDASEVFAVLNDGSRYQARLVGRDSKTDLALLKIDAGRPLPFVDLAGSEQARVGDWVLAVGNPFGLGGSVSAGIVSARGRDIHSGPYDDYIQIDAPINQGNSGGPLFDATGRVIGVNTAIYSPSGGNVGIGFAIPAATAQKVIAELKASGQVERGWLGVEIQPVTEGIAAALGRQDRLGALVADVVADSPAAKAGLRAGDLILAVNGTPVEEVKELPRMVADIRPGTRVDLAVQRNGAQTALSLTVGEMPGEEAASAVPAKQPKADRSEPRLGIYLAPLTPDARKAEGLGADAQGALVAGVEKGSAAEEAGIRPGSVVTMVGPKEVKTPEDAASQVREEIAKSSGKGVLLRIEQDGETRFVAVKPAA
jgi:serine protease Do